MKLSTLIWILIHLAWQIRKGENRTIDAEPLHSQMTREEIKHYFGVEHLSDVPEYDVTSPYVANEQGTFASYSLNHRLKRSLVQDTKDAEEYRYKINALGEKLHLHVKRNTKFMAPGLQVESRDQDGRRITRPVSNNTHYVTGKVVSDPSSLVALSVSEGLTGFVKRSRDTFIVHPLPEHLAHHLKSKNGGMPHLVYKRSSQKDFKCHTKTDKIFTKRDLSQQLQDSAGSDNEVVNKYMEVALLADEQVVATHGNNTEEFLLLIGSIVNQLFQGSTAGDIKMNYVVTRIVLITNEELGVDPSISNISHVTVVNHLAAWARDNNRDDESDPLQFDIASLVRSALIGGVAAIKNNICPSNDLVNVNSDNGLQTAYSIAHETAHNLHVGHDGNGCPNYVNIMTSTLTGGPGSLEWSSCSRNRLQNFLASNDSFCLDDPPSSARPMSPVSYYTNLPGEIVDGDTQCEYQYGPGYRRCPQKVSSCDALYCTPDGYSCSSNLMGPLEGTACGTRKWCINGFCEDNGSLKVDGGWSEWSNYTTCSRSCEGGVRYRERTCTNPPAQNGGQNCAGPLKGHWEICNSDVPCPPSQPTFHSLQCQEIDPTHVYIRIASGPCSLHCRSGHIYRFYRNVIDGTRCDHADPYIYDVCIEGQCQAVGCDHVLGSGKVKDRCGVCDGNGDSCTLVQSSYTENYIKYSYSIVDTIVELPVNTANAVFEERASTYNLIGVQDENGTNLIPIPSWWGKVVYKAGTKISYSNDAQFPDRLEIEGPTNIILKIVFAHLSEANVGIDFQYFRPLEENETSEPPTCSWVTTNWTDCSSGQQTREVRCVRSDNITGESAASGECCGEDSKPDAVNLCDRTFSWHAEDWQACTKTCGSGTQSRSVVCRAQSNATHYEVDESEAFCNTTLKPITFRSSCNVVKCPAAWRTYWSECSKFCFPGNRTKNVKCSRTNELGENEHVSDIQCEYEPKPSAINESCNDVDPCEEYAIGCFKTPEGLFSETLGDFTSLYQSDPDQALMECKELARSRNYTVFALGHGGLCMSGPDAQDQYYQHGTPAKANKCSNGIGIGHHSVAYTFDPLPEFEAVGCYKDKLRNRSLPTLYANFRPFIDWYNMYATIRQCALVARDIGYGYFGVQFYGECWSSWDAAQTYNMYNEQTNTDKCWANVGGTLTNFVYQFS